MEIKHISNFGHQVIDLKDNFVKKSDGPFGQSVSAMAHEKKMQNAAILEANAKVSLQSGNSPLSLVFKTALENINQALQETTGEENSIQNAVDQGVDVSPEATAQRILSFAIGYFDKFQENHKDLEDDEARSQFVDLIKGGIDKGFSEARNILENLNVLDTEIADNVDKTYQIIQDGLNQFLNGDSAKASSDDSLS